MQPLFRDCFAIASANASTKRFQADALRQNQNCIKYKLFKKK